MDDQKKPILTFHIQSPDEKNDYQVVEFSGDMDSQGLEQIKNRVSELAENFAFKYLVFDLSGLTFINSESIGFLMELHSHLVKIKKTLVLCSARAYVKDVLSVIGILSVVDYHSSVEAFKKKIA